MKTLSEQEILKLTIDSEVIVRYSDKTKDSILTAYGSVEKMMEEYKTINAGSLIKKLYDGIGPIYVSGILSATMHANFTNAMNGYRGTDPVSPENTGARLYVREHKDTIYPVMSLDVKGISVSIFENTNLNLSNQGRSSCIICHRSTIKVDNGMSFYDICPICKI